MTQLRAREEPAYPTRIGRTFLGLDSDSPFAIQVNEHHEAAKPVATAAADVAVVRVHGALRAICRSCPHRGCDLVAYGSLDDDGTTLRCRHLGYAFSLESGDPTEVGNSGASGRLAVGITETADDGSVWTTVGAKQ
jgi:nitrite reductase/ring-hydroxylating ferredoxin subunit